MIPDNLVNLQLPKVFAAYSSDVDKHIHETAGNQHIVDSETYKISGFVSPTFGQAEDAAQKYFAVENTSARPYSLIQINNAIIRTPRTRKCDCIVANDIFLCFIEFKANATSPNVSVIKRNYGTAIKQLEATMAVFRDFYSARGADFRRLRTVEAYVCFRAGYPRITSSQMNYQVAFARSNGIPLSFARIKIL